MDSKRDIFHLPSWAMFDSLPFKNKKKLPNLCNGLRMQLFSHGGAVGCHSSCKRKSILNAINWRSGATVSQKQKESKIASNLLV